MTTSSKPEAGKSRFSRYVLGHRLRGDDHPLYDAVKWPAETVKIIAQMVVGFSIAVIIVIKEYGKFSGHYILPLPNYIVEISVLQLVAKGLEVSAGFELAYMLFTPGPDEAIEPVLLGLAAALLLAVSHTPMDWKEGLLILLLAIALTVVFIVRQALAEGSHKSSPTSWLSGLFLRR
jgi:hypothetical protein